MSRRYVRVVVVVGSLASMTDAHVLPPLRKGRCDVEKTKQECALFLTLTGGGGSAGGRGGMTARGDVLRGRVHVLFVFVLSVFVVSFCFLFLVLLLRVSLFQEYIRGSEARPCELLLSMAVLLTVVLLFSGGEW